MAKKPEEQIVEAKVEQPVETKVEEKVEQPSAKIGRHSSFEDIPESDREVLFSTILDYSTQAVGGSIKRDTAIFLIYDKFKEIIG